MYQGLGRKILVPIGVQLLFVVGLLVPLSSVAETTLTNPSAAIPQTAEPGPSPELLKMTGDLESSQRRHPLHMDDSPVLNKILEVYKTRPGFFVGVDLTAGIIDRPGNVRSDLVVSDIIDQISQLLYKREYRGEFYAQWKQLIGDKPVENFFKAYTWFRQQLASRKNKSLRDSAKPLIVQTYSGAAMATYADEDRKFSLEKRISRFRHVQKYNLVAADADAESLLRNLSKERRDPYLSKRVTVTKVRAISSNRIDKLKKDHFKRQAWFIESEQNKSGPPMRISFKRKGTEHVQIKPRKGASRTTRRTTVPLFNAIQSHPSRDQILEFVRLATNGEVEIPVVRDDKGNKYPILTPRSIETHRDVLQEAISDYTFTELLANGDDQYLTHIRKWIKKNEAKLAAKGLDLPRPGKKPSRNEAIGLMPQMEKLFPDEAWHMNFVMHDKSGRKIRPGQSRLRGIWGRIKDFAKGLTQPYNITGLGVSLGVTALTGIPALGGIAGSLARDGSYAVAVDKPVGQHMRDVSLGNAVRAGISGSGFGGNGEFPRRIFIGGVEGSLIAKAAGRDPTAGAVGGAMMEVAFSQLPASFENPVVKGQGKNFENVLVEWAHTAAKRSVLVGGLAYVGGENVAKGLKQGARIGVVEAMGRQVLLGVKYDAVGNSGLTEEQLAQEQVTHNEIQESFYEGQKANLSLDDLKRYRFRRSFILDNRSMNAFGHEISMAPDDKFDPEEVAHESIHQWQKTDFKGEGEFYLDYVSKMMKCGNCNLYEDYRDQ